MDFAHKNYINLKNSLALINMIDGIEPMILKAPDNDKKEMLLDVIHFSKEVAEGLKTQCNSFSFINTDNSQLEIKLQMEKLKSQKQNIRIKILEAHLKAALPIEEFTNKLEQLK